MSAFDQAICPLCSHLFQREHLHTHIATEHPNVLRGTIAVIRSYYPGWAPEDGACEPCWKSYREAGRILNKLKQSRDRIVDDYGAWAGSVRERSALDDDD